VVRGVIVTAAGPNMRGVLRALEQALRAPGHPNTSVWLMRSCPEAFDVLDAVQEAGQQPDPWADQGGSCTAPGERGVGALPAV
jgi:hypothetical protein